MLRYARLVTRPAQLLRFTGLTPEQFATLTQRLTPLWQAAEQHRLTRSTRQRAIGAGRRYTLASLEDKMLAVLVFYRLSLTEELLGWLVGLDASTVYRLQQRVEPLLEQAADPALGLSLRRRLPPGVKKIGTWEKLLEVCPEFAEVMTDATEQPRQRPPRRSQRRWYSGKRKRHTVKTQLTVNKAGRVLLVSASVPGRVHDYRLFQREGTAEHVPRAAPHYVDLGYDGAAIDYPTCHVIVPVKRRRNHRVLTRGERRFNRGHARLRVGIEHVIARLKPYQVLAQVYRHRIADYNRRFRNVAALVNFRLATAIP